MKHQAKQHLAPTAFFRHSNMQRVARAPVGTPRPPANYSMNHARVQRSRNQCDQLFEPYMSAERVAHGLKTGQLIQGPIRINARRFTEAFVPSPDGTRDIFVGGMLARNRALNGDVVVVRLLPRNKWRVVRSEADSEGGGRSKPETAVGEPSSTPRPHKESTFQRAGRVVRIVEWKHSRAATGHLTFVPNSPVALFRPVDHRVPRIHVPLADCPVGFASRPGDYAGTLFICRITDWPANSILAEGTLESALGRAGEIRPETEGILAEHDVDSSEFPQDVLDCLPQRRPWTVPPEELGKRKDLRRECVITIDPAHATDLDDALSCKLLPDGNFEVGVHIADVAHFVEEGSALDTAASRRATSVYLVQKTIPMLPSLLCNDLCSLKPLVDRLTFSAVWTLTPQGKVLSEWFGRSVIRSCAKLSYEQAECMIEAPHNKLLSSSAEGEIQPAVPEHPADEIRSTVLHLHALAKNLRAQRFRDGALRLDRLKISFVLEEGSAKPRGYHIYQHRESSVLVEEFMLLANMAAARQIHRSFPELALLRRHPPPQEKMVLELQDFCDQMGLRVDFSSAGALHQSLLAAVGHDENSVGRKEVLTNMCSRVMQTAEYFCAGALGGDESRFRHYALNVPLYAHFTSPIRRYADVVVHRLLAASLGCGPPVQRSTAEIHQQARHCNDKRAASKRAQELSLELYFNVFVRDRGPLDREEAMVMGVMNHAFDVVVLRYGVQKRIYPKDMPGVDEFKHSRVGRKSELTLVWSSSGGQQKAQKVRQVVSLFAVVEVRLWAEGAGMRCVLQRPR